MAASPVLDAAGLLDLWEHAGNLGPIDRALLLAEAAGADRDVLLDRPYGQTVARVLELRTELFGPALAATATCPRCAGRAEFTVDAAWLQTLTGEPLPDGLDTQARSPSSADLLAAALAPDPDAELRRRCVPGPVRAQRLGLLDDALAAADPLAEVLVELTCPDCAATFSSDLDIAAFTWTEVDARARHLLHEVGLLARSYGWTEPQVLALSEPRRAAYLRLAAGEPA